MLPLSLKATHHLPNTVKPVLGDQAGLEEHFPKPQSGLSHVNEPEMGDHLPRKTGQNGWSHKYGFAQNCPHNQCGHNLKPFVVAL